MPRKKVSNQNDDVNRDDKNNTDYKEELKLHDRPEENQHRHDANQGQVKRVASRGSDRVQAGYLSPERMHRRDWT